VAPVHASPDHLSPRNHLDAVLRVPVCAQADTYMHQLAQQHRASAPADRRWLRVVDLGGPTLPLGCRTGILGRPARPVTVGGVEINYWLVSQTDPWAAVREMADGAAGTNWSLRELFSALRLTLTFAKHDWPAILGPMGRVDIVRRLQAALPDFDKNLLKSGVTGRPT